MPQKPLMIAKLIAEAGHAANLPAARRREQKPNLQPQSFDPSDRSYETALHNQQVADRRAQDLALRELRRRQRGRR